MQFYLDYVFLLTPTLEKGWAKSLSGFNQRKCRSTSNQVTFYLSFKWMIMSLIHNYLLRLDQNYVKLTEIISYKFIHSFTYLVEKAKKKQRSLIGLIVLQMPETARLDLTGAGNQLLQQIFLMGDKGSATWFTTIAPDYTYYTHKAETGKAAKNKYWHLILDADIQVTLKQVNRLNICPRAQIISHITNIVSYIQ